MCAAEMCRPSPTHSAFPAGLYVGVREGAVVLASRDGSLVLTGFGLAVFFDMVRALCCYAWRRILALPLGAKSMVRSCMMILVACFFCALGLGVLAEAERRGEG